MGQSKWNKEGLTGFSAIVHVGKQSNLEQILLAKSTLSIVNRIYSKKTRFV